MSSIINKVKEALHGDKEEDTTHNTHNTTGTHSTTGTHNTTGTHAPAPGSHTGTYGSSQAEGTHGPHSSRVANAADPRVDSDRDGSRTAGGNTYGNTGTHTSSSGNYTHSGSGPAPNTAGPHKSDALNKVDPRVDSDRDGSKTVGNNQGTTGTHSTTGTGGAFSSGNNTYGTHGTTGLSSGAPEGTHGPHSSRVANAADPRVDSDRDGSRTAGGNTYGTTGTHTGGNTFGTTGTHTTGTHGSGAPEGSYGPHSSRVANAADPRVDSDRDGSRGITGATGINYASGGHQTGTHGTHSTGNNFGTTGTHSSGTTEGSHGPHNSRIANALDPRVDSDRDGSRTVGNTSGTTGTTGTHGTHSTGNTFGTTGTYGSGTTEGTHGPHSSRAANAADPRVDSDRDGSRTVGGNNLSSTGGAYGTSGTHTGPHSGTHNTAVGGYSSGAPEGTHGPHSSRLANAADPRVDSDRDGSRTAGGNTAYGSTGTHGTHTGGNNFGTTGTHRSGAPEGTHGPHSSRVANAADPRVDSDRDGSRTAGGNTYGTTGTHTGSHTGSHTGTGTHGGATTHGGPAPNTVGPHKSDFLNKADPRVDSDLDGSKTVGREKTFDQQNTSYAGKDPHDAAQVPPSVMQKAIGEPIVAHDNPDHGHQKRHSVSHQEEHRGL